MNGRTVRKILMRGHVRTFFGARALFVVRVPLAAIPEPKPVFVAPGEASYEGCWSRDNGDGTRTLTHIPEVHGFRDPTERYRAKDGFIPDIHHVVCLSSETAEDGEKHERWIWYEGTELLLGTETDSSKLAPVLARKNLPAEVVNAYVKKRRWVNKYCFGPHSIIGEYVESGIGWLDELHE